MRKNNVDQKEWIYFFPDETISQIHRTYTILPIN